MLRHGMTSAKTDSRFVSEQGVQVCGRSVLRMGVLGEGGKDGIDVGGCVTKVMDGDQTDSDRTRTVVTRSPAEMHFIDRASTSGLSTHATLMGSDTMTSSSVVRRAALILALTPALSAGALAAQSSQVVVAEAATRFMSPNLQGFEARRKSGFGQFITDGALRAASGARLSHVLVQHMPAILFSAGGFAGEYPVSSRICGGGLTCGTPKCYVRVYVDGMRMYDGTPRLRDLQGIDVGRLRTEDFSGIEFYASASGLPAKYGGQNTECGTLLFWSRET
jgi:hypothetical protein